MIKKSAIKAYVNQKDVHVNFSEREQAILDKAKIFGSSTFENPQFAKTLFQINPQEKESSNLEEMKTLISWIVVSMQSAQMSKD